MTDLIIAWLAFPIVLVALGLGTGLLVARVADEAVPGALLVPVGLAGLIALAQFPVWAGAPGLTVPLAVLLALAGPLLAGPRRRVAPRPWPIAAALAVFAVYAAPIVLSGEATFAGYVKLDDTATWLAIADQVMERGLDTSGLAPSTHEATVDYNLGDGYPFGVFLPLGVGAKLLGTDPAWLIQPYMAVLGVGLLLALWSLATAIRGRFLRAAVAFVAAQPALLYGYYLWGGVKEMAAAMLLALSVALLRPALAGGAGPRQAIAPAVALAGLVAVLSPGGLAWLAPALLGVLVIVWRRQGTASLAPAGALVLSLGLLSLPLLASGRLLPPVSEPLTDATALGNLIEPLSPFQIAGVWPVGDFRVSPGDPIATAVLIALTVGAALIGLLAALRARAVATWLYVVGVIAGSMALFVAGSPWNGAKALAAGSPAVLLAAGLGVAALARAGRRTEAIVVGGLIAAGVLASNLLAYREVWLAPRDQLAELESIGERYAGEGPALITEYQPYGARHFLRALDAEGASELRRREVPLAAGGTLGKGEYADTDQLDPAGLLVYRTLVLRRSPSQSRPPLPYSLRSRGEFYEVWQRPPGTPLDLGLVEHLGVGGAGLDPGAVPSCAEVEALLARAPAGSRVVAAIPGRVAVVALGRQAHPADWTVPAGDPRLVVPGGEGSVEGTLRAPGAGVHELWVGGSVSGELELLVDGRRVGAVRRHRNNDRQYLLLGEASLPARPVPFELRYSASTLAPGAESPQGAIGPLVIRPAGSSPAIVSRPARRAEDLCGRRVDWIALAGS